MTKITEQQAKIPAYILPTIIEYPEGQDLTT